MDKIQLAEFIKSLDSETEINEGKQYTEVTVAIQQIHQLAKQLRENEDT